MRTTLGQVLINEELPDEFKDYNRILTKDQVDAILVKIAQTNPEKYSEIAKKLMDYGRYAAYEEGLTLRLRDLAAPISKSEYIRHVREQEKRIDSDPTLSPQEKEELKEIIYGKIVQALKDQTYDAALKQENPFALMVLSKARGNKDQLAAMMATPGVYQDAKDKTIPVFIERSYAEGLLPHEYWAATYGARKGVISTKFATRQAGALGKLLSNAAIDLVVVDDDCGTTRGIPVNTDDDDNIGAVIVGPYHSGSVLDKNLLTELAKKTDTIFIRSPITCESDNGVCRKCAGIRETGDFPPIGYNLGVNAASALAERLAQSSLNVKHSGKKSTDSGSEYSGFDVIKNLATVPETFPNKAVLAEEEGRVTKIEDAPQGGYNVYINNTVHYVHPDAKLNVKPGTKVNVGDPISSGIINPADIVRLKGVGEGRLAFTKLFSKAFRDSKLNVSRRNVEALARSLINHVEVDDYDENSEYLPGEIVQYQAWEKRRTPREGAKEYSLNELSGKYLEKPVLHYTVGTRVTQDVLDTLSKANIQSALAHHEPPPSKPIMLSVIKIPEYKDDWMARLGSTYLKSRLLEDVQTSQKSYVHSVHPIPGIAKGTEFGTQKGPNFTY